MPKQPRFVENRSPAEALVGRSGLGKRYYEIITVSAIATGFTNGYAHRDRIGDEASFGLAVLIVAFVERFYFVLRHGLTTVYQAAQLHNLALNPAKRDKALIVAQKLGINIDEYQITGVED